MIFVIGSSFFARNQVGDIVDLMEMVFTLDSKWAKKDPSDPKIRILRASLNTSNDFCEFFRCDIRDQRTKLHQKSASPVRASGIVVCRYTLIYRKGLGLAVLCLVINTGKVMGWRGCVW